jgi:hypothetical protein
MNRLPVLALLFTTMCGIGLAQGAAPDRTPPSRAQVLQLMSAMGVQQAVDASLHETQEKLESAARASFLKNNPDADAATLKKLDGVFESTPIFSFEEISEALIPAYQRNLSASDVQAGIDFYSSDAGKRMLEKLPVILHESNESGGQLVQQKLAAYGEELERKLQAFQAELNQKKPPANSPDANGKSKTKEDKSK